MTSELSTVDGLEQSQRPGMLFKRGNCTDCGQRPSCFGGQVTACGIWLERGAPHSTGAQGCSGIQIVQEAWSGLWGAGQGSSRVAGGL